MSKPILLQYKVFFWLVLLLGLLMLGVGGLIYNTSKELSHQQTVTLERGLIDAKKAELRYYMAFARNSIANIYHSADSNDDVAKQKAKAVLSQLSYGPDGYFFVYDYQGNNIVHPRQKFRIGKNWIDLKDPKGNFVIRDLIAAAKNGGGYTEYFWEKPSTGKIEKKISYATGLDKWGWMIGTGLYIDDISTQVARLEAGTAQQTTRSFVRILAIALGSLALVGGTGIFLTIREDARARRQLSGLAQKIRETQEMERTRVARELHDGISQQLSSAKYIFELAHMQQGKASDNLKNQSATTLEKGIEALSRAIAEIRRISKDLRPGALDDLGLAPALTTLAREFSEQSGLKVVCDLSPVKSRINEQQKTALFRIAQEALTNIARHAKAQKVHMTLEVKPSAITLEIVDDGVGFDEKIRAGKDGMGLKNMSERMAFIKGRLELSSTASGTVVRAIITPEHTAQAPAGNKTGMIKKTRPRGSKPAANVKKGKTDVAS